MFTFASFTKEDRQKVRAFKLKLMEKYYHTNDNSSTSPSPNNNFRTTRLLDNLSFGNYDASNKTVAVRNKESDRILSTGFENPFNTFESIEKHGVIGEFSNDESDDAADNFFTINIPEINTQNVTAYLQYDLFGLDSYKSVSRSINKNVAFGGNIIVPGNKWTTQKEEISLQSLQQGKNSILFTTSLSGIKYRIKDVKIVFEKNISQQTGISTLLSGDQLYVKGTENHSGLQNVNVNGLSVANVRGEFETTIQLTDEDKKRGFISISSSAGVKQYAFSKNISAFKVLNEAKFTALTVNVSKDSEYNQKYENATISIEKNSVTDAGQIQVLKLRKKDFPAVSGEVKNLIVNSGAYRLDTKFGNFTKKVKLSIPYDEKKLGTKSAKEIKAFYFDYASKKWIADPTSVVNTDAKTVTVESSGDNDYINGVISVPESPQLGASNPTGISGLKAGDAAAARNFISPPSVNQKGSANVSYPIVIPAGRKGMQPGISVSYDSNKSNGWLGEGWDVSGVSSISIDARWGSPSFDSQIETELYSLNGEMLVYDGNYLPHRHNDISETSTIFTTRKQKRDSLLADNKKVFFLRKGHNFSKIERYGTTTKDYRWVVTNTGGGKVYYGGNESGIVDNAVIKDDHDNIIQWGVWKEEDVHKNYIEYEYENFTVLGLTGENDNLNGGRYFHIRKINYTKAEGQSLKYYTVEFEKESRITRQDISINAKRGVKEVEPYKLSKIYVKYDEQLIRTYTFSYKEGQFFKTLLSNVKHTDTSNDVAYNNLLTEEFNFEYFDDIKSTPTSSPVNFGNTVDINGAGGGDAFPILPNFLKPSKISANNTFEWGVNGRVPGVGLDFLLPGPTRSYGHVMASFNIGHSEAEAKKAQELMDFDGDGIPDLIYRRPSSGLYLRSGSLASGNINFGPERKIQYLNSNFSLTKTKTQNIGYDAGIKVFSIGFNFSQMWTNSKSETSSFILDANSDGVMDVAQDGQVLFGRINPINGNVEMTQYSDNTENMVIVADTMMEHFSPLEGSWQDVSKNDVVKVWVAPMDGYINFVDTVQVENLPNAKAQYSVEIRNPATADKNGRIYLKEFTAGMAPENITITNFNSYYSQIQGLTPTTTDHLAISNPGSLYVKSGEKVFVRLHKNENYSFKVLSNPVISYVGVPKPVGVGLYQDGFRFNNGSYGDNFLLNNHTKPISIDLPGTVNITVPSVSFPNSQDDITFKIVKINTNTGAENIVYSQTYPQNDNAFTTTALSGIANVTNLSFTANDVPSVLKFVVESDSHTAFKDSNWNRINVNYYPTGGNAQNYTAVADYPSHFITEFTPVVNIKQLPNAPNGNLTYKIGINKSVPANSVLPTGSFYYIVKKNGKVITKRRIIAPINSSGSIVEVNMANNQTISGVSPAPFYTGDLNNNNTIFIDNLNIQVYCKTKADYEFYKAYSALFQDQPFDIYYGANTYWASVKHTSINSASLENVSQFYKNWGQFLYNEYADVVPTGGPEGFMLNTATPADNYGRVINLSSMEEINIPVNLNFPMCNNLPTQDETAQCIAQQISNTGFYQNPANFAPKPITLLTPAIYKTIGPRDNPYTEYTEKWIGIGPEQYAMADSFKDNESVTGFFDPQTANPDVPDSLLLQGNVDTKMFSINKKYYSKSRTNTLSGSLFNFGIQNATSVLVGDGNIALQDFLDMNGDGYPDAVYKDAVQLTNSTGGHGGLRNPFINAYISNTDSYSKSLSPQYSAAAFIQTGASSRNGEVRSNTNMYSYSPNVAMNSGIETSASWSGQASVNYDSKDTGESYWMDVNGDGLADRVTGGGTNNMKYQLNLGYRLDNGYSYKNAETFASGPVGSIGLSGGFDFSGSSGLAVSVSANASAALGSSKTTFEDINADGLSDILVVGSSNTYVKYNLGNRFSDPVELFKNGSGLDYNNEAKTYRGGISVGGGYYYTFPIVWWPFPPIPLIYLKVGGQVSGSIGLSIAEVDKSFKDMNGDGFPDLVVSKNDGFEVNYSTIGRTNKLKSVTNFKDKAPFSVFSLDYEYTKPTYDDAHGRLVMKEVRIVNPDIFSITYLAPTNNKDIVKTFKYEEGRYDRREREFFGFGKITSYDMWYSNAVYRSQINYYHNKSYFLNGKPKRSESYTGTNVLNSSAEYEYSVYKYKDNNTKIDIDNPVAESYDTGGQEGRKMGIALLEITRKKEIETGGYIQIAEAFTYNDKGFVTRFLHMSPTSNYNTTIDYHDYPSPNNIITAPKSVKVYEGLSTSNPIRERYTKIDPVTGLLQKVSVKLNSSDFANTDFAYDSFGNLTSVIYPENEAGAHYTLNYDYDSDMHKYVVNVNDISGYSSSSEYDPKFDVVTQTTDVSGNTTEYEYDQKGRIIKILAPKEKEASAEYTVRYSYHTQATPNINLPYVSNNYVCVTENYNPQDPSNPVETINISDGWGKVVQTKKDILLDGVEKMSVSGRTIHDVIGRAVSTFHPMSEDKYLPNDPNHSNKLLNMTVISSYSSSVERDTKDRVKSTTDELFHTASTIYSVENNMIKSTQELLQNSSTMLKSETFTNIEGKTVQVNNYLNGQALTTKFQYNTIGELLNSTDPENIKTYYSYDLAGRRISMEHPDHGINRYDYDPVGNIIRMYTSNMENTSPNQQYIHYIYDSNRLSDIQFPDLQNGSNPSNVHYKYGAAGSGNSSGKIILKSDSSGQTKYEYGNMGEVVGEIRIVSGYGIPTMQFTTQFEYDSWNRIQKLIYADGELINYDYDLGGNLVRIYSKDGYEYVKNITYDHYEQRMSIDFGNNMRSEFTYDPADRKLSNHLLKDGSGTDLLNNTYMYDYVGNITGLENGAGVYNQLGGSYNFSYAYDHLNRLASSSGNFVGDSNSPFGDTSSAFDMGMVYNKAGAITEKNQVHNQNGASNGQNTYNNVYEYNPGTHQVFNINDPNTGSNEKFEYDYNGNVTRIDKNGEADHLYWDEADRLKAVNKESAGIFQYYVYDDAGERIIKSNIEQGAQLYQNGQVMDPGSIYVSSYKVYPNAYHVENSDNKLTKHYYAGTQRIASRIIDFDFSAMKQAGSGMGNKQKDEDKGDLKIYLEKAGIDFSQLTTELAKGPQQQNGVYYMHGDHLGTATFVTEHHGEATQFFLNLPFGETMAEQMTGIYNNPYKFNAKELDEETGLYYYGARYYNPRLSIWFGVDPLAEKMPRWSPYNYAFNNPVRYTDPTGMAPEKIPVSGSKEHQKTLVSQINEVTGGDYEVKNGLLVAKNGKYGTGTNADLFKSAITSENDFPINAVNNENSTFVDTFADTNVDVGDIAKGNKEIKGSFYAHIMKERLEAGERYSDSGKRLNDLQPRQLGGMTMSSKFTSYHNAALIAEVDALSFHTGIPRSTLTERQTTDLPSPSIGTEVDYGAYKYKMNTDKPPSSGSFKVLSITK